MNQEKKYNVTVLEGNTMFSYKKLHYTFTQSELDKLKKDIVGRDYSGAYKMKNGDLVEVEEVA